MRDYSKNRDPMVGKEIAWYEMIIPHMAFVVVMVIGPPVEWLCDRTNDLLDRVWPERPKPPPRRIP